VGARGRSSLAASVGPLVEERQKSREHTETVDKSISQLNEQKLKMQISHNLEENVNRLIETKKKLKTETDPGIIKVLRKYEKRLNKVIDMSSSSSSESDAD
jgi:rubrerythrin